MEVGIEDCLHIEFEYNKSRYHLRDTVVGKIYFLLVRRRLCHSSACKPNDKRAMECCLDAHDVRSEYLCAYGRHIMG